MQRRRIRMLPLRASTPTRENQPLDLSLNISGSLGNSYCLNDTGSTWYTEEEQQQQQDQVRKQQDEQSESSCSSVLSVSSQESQESQETESMDVTSEILDYNDNEITTAYNEMECNTSINSPTSVYKDILLSDQFTDFIKDELHKVTAELEQIKEKKDKSACLTVHRSAIERLGGP